MNQLKKIEGLFVRQLSHGEFLLFLLIYFLTLFMNSTLISFQVWSKKHYTKNINEFKAGNNIYFLLYNIFFFLLYQH